MGCTRSVSSFLNGRSAFKCMRNTGFTFHQHHWYKLSFGLEKQDCHFDLPCKQQYWGPPFPLMYAYSTHQSTTLRYLNTDKAGHNFCLCLGRTVKLLFKHGQKQWSLLEHYLYALAVSTRLLSRVWSSENKSPCLIWIFKSISYLSTSLSSMSFTGEIY